MVKKQTRKSRSQLREEQRQQRVRLWMGIFVIGVMLLSVVSFAFVFYGMPGPGGTMDGLQYRIDNNQLFIQTRVGEVQFYSWPTDHVTPPQEAQQLIRNAESLIVLFDPTDEENLMLLDLVRWDFSQYMTIPVGAAVTEASTAYPLEVGSCETATEQTPVIFFTAGNQGIQVEDACIIVSAEQDFIILERDQILYSYLGIA